MHPRTTICNLFEERHLSGEFARRIGVTPAYVSCVISGKKDISENFVQSPEYPLGV